MWTGDVPMYPRPHQTSHLSRHRAELAVMSDRDPSSGAIGRRNQRTSLGSVDRKRLLNQDVRACSQAAQANGKMASGRRCDVDHIRPCRVQKIIQVRVPSLDRKAFGQLLRHDGITVAHSDETAVLYSPYLRSVRIRNLATSDNADSKHGSPD